MFESGYFPPGAEHDPNAPYNQSDPDPIDIDCYVSCSISKDVTVSTTDYIAEKWEDWDMDAEGDYVHSGGVDYDFSNCNFSEVYHQNHYGILELLEQLKVFLEGAIEKLEQLSPEASKEEKAARRANLRIYKQMLEDCQGWTLDEEEVGKA